MYAGVLDSSTLLGLSGSAATRVLSFRVLSSTRVRTSQPSPASARTAGSPSHAMGGFHGVRTGWLGWGGG